jgi:hypothetical protein
MSGDGQRRVDNGACRTVPCLASQLADAAGTKAGAKVSKSSRAKFQTFGAISKPLKRLERVKGIEPSS